MVKISQPLPRWLPPQPTAWQRFRRNPPLFIAQWLYPKRINPPTPAPPENSITAVCISDTHNSTPNVPDGDLLLHAGDLSAHGSFEEIQAQLDWLNSLPHIHKVVIAGNHDLLLDADFVARSPDRIYEGDGSSCADLNWSNVVYLNNTSARLAFPNGRSLSVYGSPWTPMFGNWAFQYPDIRSVWPGTVPPATDVLLTHGPPKGHLDNGGKGCPQLLREVSRVRPRLVVFGHIHIGRGVEHVEYNGFQKAYDGIMTGDKGLGAAVKMALWFVWELCRRLISGREAAGGTTLVNAAVVGAIGQVEHNGTVITL